VEDRVDFESEAVSFLHVVRARVLRYDVRDSKRALEELKAVLEKYKTVHTVPV
jgi:small ligand-binding sensory domain FIST